MSPLLRRLRDWFTAPTPADMATDEHDDSDEPRKRRRRGRRGGRGRNKSNQTTNGTTQTTATSEAPTATRERSTSSSSNGRSGRDNESSRNSQTRDRRDSRDRSDDRRDNRGRDDRRRRRPWRSSLEEPLPEDVAFRPPSEGGDRTILPARRRPPPGLHATRRVLVSGTSRFVPHFGRGDAEADTEAPSNTTAPATSNDRAAAPRDTESGTDGDAPKRRRRGRRGGRGRRRSEGADGSLDTANDTLNVDDDVAEADDSEESSDDTRTPAIEVDAPRVARRRPARAPRNEARRDETSAERPRSEQPSKTGRLEPTTFDGDLPEAFRELGVGDNGLRAVGASGFTDPTPIQAQAIPALIEGHDVVGVAQTGSGKTVAFGLPLLEACDPDLAEPQAIVLVPTRELAQQVLEVLTDLGSYSGVRVVGLLGGRALDRDFRALERGPQVVVGTPGRVLDHIKRRTLSLRAVRYAVLDEADEMLDIGFLPDITRILGQTPRARQTALFSATMPTSIKNLVHRYMHDPVTVTVDPELSSVESIEQVYFEVAERDKMRGLAELVKRELKGRTIVFSKTRRGADRLSERLQTDGIRIGALHGDLDQRQRDRVVQRFRDGELDILVATNVAARGIDIPEITHVVNYDVPQNVEEYVHRIGRTGRMGREGKAITFVCEHDVGEFDAIMEAFGDKLHQERLDLYG